MFNFSTKIIRLLKSDIFVHRVSKSLSTLRHSKFVRTKMDIDIKSRENPVVLKLDTPEFKNIFTEEVESLKMLFDKYEYEIRVAGGAVRDLLMGKQPKDLDFATTATPQQMKDMATAENIRMVNMNGEKHGTITMRINDKENFEVTTLRVDVLTDGRHAAVEFITDWKLDANRRDLTINSMFLGFDGSVYDYFYGYDDLKKKRVAFVGDPDVRIKEDYLRILRYFRFYGRIAEKPDNHEENTLQVITQNVKGLENISGERLWVEVKKILEGRFGGDIMMTMLHVGIGTYIGLSGKLDTREFERVSERNREHKLHPISLMAALMEDLQDAEWLHGRLKLSAYERDLCYFLVVHRIDNVSGNALLYYKKKVVTSKLKHIVAIDYCRELMKYKGEFELLEEFDHWDPPRFPINGAILKENGVPPGKLYGLVLNKLKEIWADQEFRPTSEDLVKFIPDILRDIEEWKKSKN